MRNHGLIQRRVLVTFQRLGQVGFKSLQQALINLGLTACGNTRNHLLDDLNTQALACFPAIEAI